MVSFEPIFVDFTTTAPLAVNSRTAFTVLPIIVLKYSDWLENVEPTIRSRKIRVT